MSTDRAAGAPTARTTLRRRPERGRFDAATLFAILDEGLVCHLGFLAGGQPYVIPTTYARRDGWLYVHGSAASRMLTTLAEGVPVCLTVTLLDGLVLARSAFHHSMNYRSVVVLGTAVPVEGTEKEEALRAIVDHMMPGRWTEARPPTALELKATLVLKLALDEASAKVRTGPPIDDEEDYGLDCWAGVIPLRLAPGAVEPDPRLPAGRPVPAAVARYSRPPENPAP